jgi:hypothetical protein
VDAEQPLFELEGVEGGQSSGEAVLEPAKKTNEAKRSISYVLDAVLEFGKVTGFADLLDRIAMLCFATGYSPFNALLMLLQRPAATHVLPAHQWQERYGFVIRPGEQPMVLLQPGGPLMFLLDVSQVEPGAGALPLPVHLSNPYAMADVPDVDTAFHWIVENAKFDGVRVTPAPLGIGFAGCVSPSQSGATQRVTVRMRPQPEAHDVPVRFDVELNRSYSPTEKLATIAHELGHVYCGHLGADRDEHWKDRRPLDRDIRELEAESVARVVFASLSPGARLPDHLSQYFAEEPDLAGASLEAVLKAAGRVLGIANGWGPRWK